jgi:hypothetical protein
MTKFLSRLVRRLCIANCEVASARSSPETYESVVKMRSKMMPGITFEIKRVSFGRRMELARRVREISQRAEFLEAGGQLQEKIEASLLRQEIEATYLQWGLSRLDGLTIDGEPANAERLIEKGPEELTREIVTAIKGQCGLSEEERKN